MINFKVNPEKLIQVADEIDGINKHILNELDQIQDCADTLQQTWEGEISDIYIIKMNELWNKREKVNMMFTEYIKKLREVAGIYVTTENKTLEKAQGLPTQGIFS